MKSKISRRKLFSALLGLGGATAGVCVNMRKRPDKLERWQVWDDTLGQRIIIMSPPEDGLRGWSICSCHDGRHTLKRASTILSTWTYVGNAREMKGRP